MFNRKILATLVTGVLMTAAARADDSGFYLGASVGEATQSGDGFSDGGTSFRLMGGYSFGKYFAAEAGYVDGGTQEDDIGSLHAAIKSDGFFVTARVLLPLGEVITPYAKLGYVVYDSTTTLSNGTQQVSESISDEDLSYGMGVEFRIGEKIRLRADYEKVDVPDVAFDIYSIGATFHF